MAGDPNTIVPGCYYPGCDNETKPGKKFCESCLPTKEYQVAAKKAKSVKANPTKAGAKSSSKQSSKKTAGSKKSSTTSGRTKNGSSSSRRGGKTKKAAVPHKRSASIDWPAEIADIKKLPAKSFPIAVDMGSPGSAQVTRVRLKDKPYCTGLTITTQGTSMIFERA